MPSELSDGPEPKVPGRRRDASSEPAPSEIIRVVRGAPTPEELAALVGVVIARSRPVTAHAPARASRWTRAGRPRLVSGRGLPARPAPDAWRELALPTA